MKKLISVFISLLICVSAVSALEKTFETRASISNEYYDTNYDDGFHDYDNATIVGIGFTLELQSQKTDFTFSYDPSYSFYEEDSDDNTLRHNLNVDFSTEFAPRTTLTLRDQFTRTEEFIIDVDDPRNRRDGNPRNRNEAEVEFYKGFGESNEFILNYTNTYLEYEETNIDNNLTHNPSANFNYWFTQRWGIELGSSYIKSIYDLYTDEYLTNILRLNWRKNRSLTFYFQFRHNYSEIDDFDESNNNYNPSVGFVWSTENDLVISMGAGYLYDENEYDEANEDDDISDWTFDGEISKVWTFRKGNMSLSGTTGYEISYIDERYQGLSNYYRAIYTAEYSFLRNLTGDILGSYSWEKGLYNNLEDNVTSAEVGLLYNATEKLDLDCRYIYRNRDSDIVIDDYVTNTGRLSAFYNLNRYIQFDSRISYQDYDARSDARSYTETRFYIGATFFPYTYRSR